MSARADRARRHAEAGLRWARLLAPGPRAGGLRVGYGHDHVPGPGERGSGGTSKSQKLATRFPNRMGDFTLLYLSSSGLPRDLRQLLWVARRRGAPVVLNQDGVGYPAWAGERWEQVNRPLREALRGADHVLYQSSFSRDDADRYLGLPTGQWEILPNAVDCERFTPSASPPEGGPVLLLAGNQTSSGRLVLALATLEHVLRDHPGARLVVAGTVPSGTGTRLGELVRDGTVELAGPYTQDEAPALYRRAHLLLHTKVLDPCPNTVLEALACGLPVVHPASGGTPELVGDAGVGVAHEVSHDALLLPEPEQMAAAVTAVLGNRAELGRRARRRAVERFPLDRWLDRHAELFDELVVRARRPPT